MELKAIEELVDRLSERVNSLLEERSGLKQEIDRLNGIITEREGECERLKQEMARNAEAAAEEATRLEHNGSEIESKLQQLNDRLVTLVQQQG